jgi:hypothetical protein
MRLINGYEGFIEETIDSCFNLKLGFMFITFKKGHITGPLPIIIILGDIILDENKVSYPDIRIFLLLVIYFYMRIPSWKTS